MHGSNYCHHYYQNFRLFSHGFNNKSACEIKKNVLKVFFLNKKVVT